MIVVHVDFAFYTFTIIVISTIDFFRLLWHYNAYFLIVLNAVVHLWPLVTFHSLH